MVEITGAILYARAEWEQLIKPFPIEIWAPGVLMNYSVEPMYLSILCASSI